MTIKIDPFVRSYLETALWSSTDDNGISLDAQYQVGDCSPKALAQAESDCRDFREQSGEEFDNEEDAHNFWLTRNRHGAGFWDGDYPEPDATRLTELSHSFGTCWLYIGDDGMIYCS